MDQKTCEIILDKLLSGECKDTSLINNNHNKSFFNVKIDSIKNPMTLKITFRDISSDKYFNEQLLNINVGFPKLIKEIEYENKLFSFYEHYEYNLGDFFKTNYTKQELNSVIDQINVAMATYKKLYNTDGSYDIKNFLYNHKNNKIKVCLFDFKKNTNENISRTNIINNFFTEELQKYISKLDMYHYCMEQDSEALTYIEKEITHMRILQNHEKYDPVDIFTTDMLYIAMNKWLIYKNIFEDFITFLHSSPHNFPYNYSK